MAVQSVTSLYPRATIRYGMSNKIVIWIGTFTVIKKVINSEHGWTNTRPYCMVNTVWNCIYYELYFCGLDFESKIKTKW